MTIADLSNILTEMYDTAPQGDKNVFVFLFGIKYGKLISEKRYSPSEIIRNTNAKTGKLNGKGNLSELRKGIKLSKYVTLTEEACYKT